MGVARLCGICGEHKAVEEMQPRYKRCRECYQKVRLRGLASRKAAHLREIETGSFLRPIVKKCTRCKSLKSGEEFTLCLTTKDGLDYKCKECLKKRTKKVRTKEQRRNQWLMQKFGITAEQFEMLLRIQGGGCAICGGPPALQENYSMDHCHKTNTNRGLLCGKCNLGIGYFNDRHDLLIRASEYLRNPPFVSFCSGLEN